MADTLDESTIITETYQVPDGYLPKGNWWDEEGACYRAEECDPARYGCKWRWSAQNLKALAKGYTGQKLLPFILPEGKE